MLLQLFGIGYIIALEPLGAKGEAGAKIMFAVLEVFMAIDFIMQFLKVPADMEDPSLKKTVKRYLKRKFFFDFIATFISGVLFVIPTGVTLKWNYRLKLARFVRINEVRRSYRNIIKHSRLSP